MANKSKWKNEFILDAYELMKQGAKRKQVARICGVSMATFVQWEKKRSLVRMAMKRGKKAYRGKVNGRGRSEIADYVFNGLNDEMKKIWNKLSKASRCKSPRSVMLAILEGKGRAFRQHLFLYAFVNGNFRITEACRRIGISVREYDQWRQEDEDFARLFKEVLEAKKDLCESHLLGLVKKGSEAATIYSVKTLCKDRGYVEKVEHEVNVKGEVNHNVLPFNKIMGHLSEGCQIEILEALRKVKRIESGEEVATGPSHLLPHSQTLEAEFVPNVN
jgi:hypothetical protein